MATSSASFCGSVCWPSGLWCASSGLVGDGQGDFGSFFCACAGGGEGGWCGDADRHGFLELLCAIALVGCGDSGFCGPVGKVRVVLHVLLVRFGLFFGSMSITQLYIGSTHINDKKNN